MGDSSSPTPSRQIPTLNSISPLASDSVLEARRQPEYKSASNSGQDLLIFQAAVESLVICCPATYCVSTLSFAPQHAERYSIRPQSSTSQVKTTNASHSQSRQPHLVLVKYTAEYSRAKDQDPQMECLPPLYLKLSDTVKRNAKIQAIRNGSILDLGLQPYDSTGISGERDALPPSTGLWRITHPYMSSQRELCDPKPVTNTNKTKDVVVDISAPIKGRCQCGIHTFLAFSIIPAVPSQKTTQIAYEALYPIIHHHFLNNKHLGRMVEGFNSSCRGPG